MRQTLLLALFLGFLFNASSSSYAGCIGNWANLNRTARTTKNVSKTLVGNYSVLDYTQWYGKDQLMPNAAVPSEVSFEFSEQGSVLSFTKFTPRPDLYQDPKITKHFGFESANWVNTERHISGLIFVTHSADRTILTRSASATELYYRETQQYKEGLLTLWGPPQLKRELRIRLLGDGKVELTYQDNVSSNGGFKALLQKKD